MATTELVCCQPSSCLTRELYVQVQPSCVQLVMPQTGTALQDFIAGQEASIRQHGLDGAAGREGLQVQLQLQEGCARVEALIQQEVHLVKQELLSARLRSPAQVKSTGSRHTMRLPCVPLRASPVNLLRLPCIRICTQCTSICWCINPALRTVSTCVSTWVQSASAVLLLQGALPSCYCSSACCRSRSSKKSDRKTCHVSCMRMA